MKQEIFVPFLFVLLCSALLGACASDDIYRNKFEPCVGLETDTKCRASSIQVHNNPGRPDENYLLGFVELNDQGHMPNRRQLHELVNTLDQESKANDLLMVVFVHGWHHNAGYDENGKEDGNVVEFRDVLKRLSRAEAAASQSGSGYPRRKVVGVYIGWRGDSVEVPLLKDVTFWERKNTAHDVGNGAIMEVLARLDQIRRAKTRPDKGNDDSLTRLVVIGHSFGGAVVYSAVSQILMERLVQASPPSITNTCKKITGFGDLVVLMNPAFEASLHKPLRDTAGGCTSFSPQQLPVLAVLTSEDDFATRYLFPLGRWPGTLFESYKGDSSRDADYTAVGHHLGYITHDLNHAGGNAGEAEIPAQESYGLFAKVLQGWTNDAPEGEIPFPGSKLKRRGGNTTLSHNPYLVIRVDEKIIQDHNKIYDQRVMDFLRHLIMLSTATPQQRTNAQRAMPAQ
jgi:pimeloyl-ACP methyl ester carboxylesterase